MSDLIKKQDAINVLNIGAELLRRILDNTYIVGAERAKYEWGLGLIESYISDMKELPSAEPEIIRCKDCKYWHQEIHNGIEYFNFSSCDLNHYGDGHNFYCADAEWEGKWVLMADGYHCSLCNYKLQTTGIPMYCPNCGVRMGGKDE